MKKLMGILGAALLAAQLLLPALAQEPPIQTEAAEKSPETEAEIGRLDLPAFDAALWPAPRPIDSPEEAIQYAKEVFSCEYVGADLTGAQWDTQWTDIEQVNRAYVEHRSGCQVLCTLPGGEQLTLLLYADGGGVRLLFGPPAGEDFTRWVNVPPEKDDPWRESLWQFALDLLEAMEPGITDSFISLRDHGDFLIDGIRFVQLEFIIDDDLSKQFRLQVFPQIRLLDAYTGLG